LDFGFTPRFSAVDDSTSRDKVAQASRQFARPNLGSSPQSKIQNPKSKIENPKSQDLDFAGGIL
jgi:hypothetical protein